MKILSARAGDVLIGGGNPIVVQTMCNTHTSDVEATVAQCVRLSAAGAQMIRLTVPAPSDVECVKAIKSRLAGLGVTVPIVADIHFSSQTAILVAPHVEKVRINPGNFHRDHAKAREQFARLIEVCREHGTAIRIGINHGSLGEYITNLYGNSPEAMAKAAMEWLGMCIEARFFNVVVSLKSSNTIVMVDAYRKLAEMMEGCGYVFPLHLGVTEAGNGDSGRIKSCVGISSLLSEGIGDTVRVSLTEDPEAEIPVAEYLAARYDHKIVSSMTSVSVSGRRAVAHYDSPSYETLLLVTSERGSLTRNWTKSPSKAPFWIRMVSRWTLRHPVSGSISRMNLCKPQEGDSTSLNTSHVPDAAGRCMTSRLHSKKSRQRLPISKAP